MKHSKKRARTNTLAKLVPAAVAVAGVAHAGPPMPPPPPPPPPAPPPPPTTALPPLPKFVDTNVLKIKELKLTPSLPKAGDTVTVKLTIMNESPVPLANVDWKLGGALNETGRIGSIAPHATQTVTKTFTAQGTAVTVLAEVDPAQRIIEPSENRKNNTAALKTAVSAVTNSDWIAWARKSADRIGDFLDVMKAATSVEGEVNGSTLKVKKLKVGSFSTAALKQTLTSAGIPTDVAQAILDSWTRTYKEWAANYQAVVPWAYPGFAAYPGPNAAPMPNVPFPLIVGGGPAANQFIKVDAIETDMKGRLSSARQGAADGASSVRNLAQAFAGQFATWLTVQQVAKVMGRGPVPSFAPPYVPVGPVVGGDNVSAPSHLP